MPGSLFQGIEFRGGGAKDQDGSAFQAAQSPMASDRGERDLALSKADRLADACRPREPFPYDILSPGASPLGPTEPSGWRPVLGKADLDPGFYRSYRRHLPVKFPAYGNSVEILGIPADAGDRAGYENPPERRGVELPERHDSQATRPPDAERAARPVGHDRALAGWAPTGGVALLAQTEPDSASRDLVPSIAAGIAASNHGLEERFRDACPEVKERVSRSVERGPIGTLVKKINGSICQISEALGHKPIAS